MLSIGLLVTIFVWVLAIVLGLAFGGFMHRVSKGETRWHVVFKDIGKILKCITKPHGLIAIILIIAGLCVIGSAVSYHYVQATTGYKYSLLSSPSKHYVPEIERIITIPAYELWESPIVTTQVLTFLDTGKLLLGLWLVVIGLIIGAWGSVKAVNRAYEVS